MYSHFASALALGLVAGCAARLAPRADHPANPASLATTLPAPSSLPADRGPGTHRVDPFDSELKPKGDDQ